MTNETTTTPKSRDAAATRRLLLRAARHRFAYDGYSATTVRDIAADAGVNVALINRYFTNKEGLFAACLERAAEDLDEQTDHEQSDRSAAVDVDGLVQRLVEHIVDRPTGEHPVEFLLLIRSSGDEQADRIRQATLRSYTERTARIAGWSPDDPTTDHLLLRAQIAIATGFGIVMLRASAQLEPLANASAADLSAPLGDAVRSLLGPSA